MGFLEREALLKIRLERGAPMKFKLERGAPIFDICRSAERCFEDYMGRMQSANSSFLEHLSKHKFSAQ